MTEYFCVIDYMHNDHEETKYEYHAGRSVYELLDYLEQQDHRKVLRLVRVYDCAETWARKRSYLQIKQFLGR